MIVPFTWLTIGEDCARENNILLSFEKRHTLFYLDTLIIWIQLVDINDNVKEKPAFIWYHYLRFKIFVVDFMSQGGSLFI